MPASVTHDTPLTDKQHRLMTFLYASLRDRGMTPSHLEICEHLGAFYQSAVCAHLRLLEKKGYVELGANRRRGVRILRKPDGSPFRGFAEKA